MKTEITKAKHPYDARLGLESDIEAFFKSTRLVTATGFFRLDDMFNDLGAVILPGFLNICSSNRKLKILSVGCSDGREPYSLAMAIQQRLESTHKIELMILACDVNRDLIEIARRGFYTLRKDEKRKVRDYHTGFLFLSEDKVLVKEAIRRKVHFRVADILRLETEEPYSIAVCANLLLYYDQEYRTEILRKLAALIQPEGYLYVESVGTKFMETMGFYRIFPGSHFFRKRIFS